MCESQDAAYTTTNKFSSRFFFSDIEFEGELKDHIAKLDAELTKFDTLYSDVAFKEFRQLVFSQFLKFKFTDTSKYLPKTMNKLTQDELSEYIDSRDIRVAPTVGNFRQESEPTVHVLNKIQNQIKECFGIEMLNRVEAECLNKTGRSILEELSAVDLGYQNASRAVNEYVKQFIGTISSLNDIGAGFMKLTTSLNPTFLIETNLARCGVVNLPAMLTTLVNSVGKIDVDGLQFSIAKYMFYREYITRIQSFKFLGVQKKMETGIRAVTSTVPTNDLLVRYLPARSKQSRIADIRAAFDGPV